MCNKSIKKIVYNDKYDVLDVYFDDKCFAYGEEYGNVIIMKSMEDDSIVGIVILSPNRREDDVKKCINIVIQETSLDFDLNSIKSNLKSS